MAKQRHKQEFLKLRSGNTVAGCSCEWVGNPRGHFLRKNAVAEYNDHKNEEK